VIVAPLAKVKVTCTVCEVNNCLVKCWRMIVGPIAL
jgi:hypothetical protein